MCFSQASCAARSTLNGAWRIRSRGWPRLLAVGAGAAPVLHQEEREPLLGRAQVLLRVHRPQQRVLGDALVEAVDEAPEGLLAADLLVEGLLLKRAARNLFHALHGLRRHGVGLKAKHSGLAPGPEVRPAV